MSKTTTINGVDVIEDGDVTHFVISEETKRTDELKRRKEQDENLSFWQRLGAWFKKHEVEPYIKTKDLADPFNERIRDDDDLDAGSDGRHAVEVGIRGTF